jgi:hypothetical protein
MPGRESWAALCSGRSGVVCVECGHVAEEPWPGLVCASSSRPSGSRCPVSGHSGQPASLGEPRGQVASWPSARLATPRQCVRSIGLDHSAKLEREIASRSWPMLFVFTLSHAMVATPMRTRFDQLGKQMVRTALETRGPVETDAEVPADTRRIDLWFMPDPARGSVPDHLGVLGRIADGPSSSTTRRAATSSPPA